MDDLTRQLLACVELGKAVTSTLDREEIDARLQLAALDGKLPGNEQITAKDLRHTYLTYLVRQGVRLSELEQIVGKMPSKVLLNYRQFLPDKSDRTLKEISITYPFFRSKF